MSMTHRFIATALAALLASATFVAAQPSAHAFCGFYVGGAGQQMFNDATQVVMMREGTTTILSMRNNYQGPPTDFAMVVPVPQILSEETVKVLDDAVFDRVDTLTAPRLVEYWEQDPCYQPPPQATYDHSTAVLESAGPMPRRSRDKDTGVTIEAQFDVGEYEIVILSAEESNGLERWLDQNDYNIPDGAAKVLDPYITQGMYFFVAKVNPDKVDFAKDGTTMLSPLRFHYTSEDFSLPVRLGLLNARGPQDLIINILAREQRFEMANYENVAIPTNLHVAQTVRDNFAQFYVALFDFVLEENPGAVVTEYSWGAQGCDPCPSPPLDGADMLALGADVVVGQPGATKLEMDKPLGSLNWVVTRLHARYTLETLKDDLVFRAAPPIVGGRGMPQGPEGDLNEEGAQPSRYTNNFQGRYVMLNRWEGPVECEDPQYGRWGGKPESGTSEPSTNVAQDTAFTKRDAVDLASAITDEKFSTGSRTPDGPHKVNLPDPPKARKGMCACTSLTSSPLPPAGVVLGVFGLVMAAVGRRRRS